MVTIDSHVVVKYMNEPFVTIPQYLIVEGSAGQKYLKMRASSLPIVQLLTGAKNPARASLTFYQPFQKLVEKRNEAMDRHATGDEDQGDMADLFENHDEEGQGRSNRRHRLQNLPETVNIYVGNTIVPCLIPQEGKRPKAADLAVPLDSNTIAAIIDHVRASAEDLEMHMKQPRKKAKQNQ